MKKIIAAILLIPCIYALLAVNPASTSLENMVTLTYKSSAYPETNAYLHNPYRGYYHIYGYVLKNEQSYQSPDDVPNIPNPETTQTVERLVQVQINLCRFANQPIPELALQQLDMILDAWSRTDYAVILRILYDWDGRALQAEPDSIDQIMAHMEQTAEVYNKYADTIFMIQGLSTGNNGEMHHTSYGARESLQPLGQKLAEVSAPSIYLSVRTPFQWRCVTGVDNYSELAALPESPFLGRLGLYNDGMFGSESDTGTYIGRTREEELQFQNELCRTVPNGGEAIIDNPYNDLYNAIRDMRTMHVSYLNSVHDPAVLNKWAAEIYHGDDEFDGVSGYEYIRNHLGYRYVLRSCEISERHGGELLLSIENVGFSASYRHFSFVLTLLDSKTGACITVHPDFDSQSLPGSEEMILSIPLNIYDYPPSTYELYWQTTDPISGEYILYGNDMELTEYGYHLGSLTLERTDK